MYNIHDYGDMVADRGRTHAYAEALRARLTPDSVVLEIGAGPGILTLLACQMGARRVYAVEPAGIIEVARESAADNGYADRVELIQAFSTAIDLPEKVDVIVADIHGPLPFFSGSLTSILDARDRFLKPGGFVVPMTETVSVAIVTLPAAYKSIVGPWENSFGLDCAAARRRALSSSRPWRCPSAALVVEPKVWSVLDYLELQSPSARGDASWTISQACQAHGLSMWFDCETAPGCSFSNSPLSGEEHLYGQVFFPWTEACELEAGDQVAVEIRADVVGEDYIWSWNTDIRGPNNRGSIKAQFRQSQFLSAPVSADWLRKSGASFVPSPNQDACIDKMILDLLVEELSLEEISQRVSDRFPERFPKWQKALTRVGNMSLRYSR